MNAENASEPQQTVTKPAAETGSEQLKEVPVAGEQQASISEPTAETRSREPSGSNCRPPRRSRSRSPVFEKLQLPTLTATWVNFSTGSRRQDQILIPVIRKRPRCMLEGFWIDWDTLKKWTELNRVIMLKKILNDQEASDAFKLYCVNQKVEDFDHEDDLLERLQDAETKDFPPPDTPEDKERKIQVKALFSELLTMRSSLYHDVSAGISFCA